MATSLRLGIAIAFALACCSCAEQNDSGRAPSVILSALHRGNWPSSISFTGHWELVRDRTDGRFEGSSSRSFRAGDTMTLIFTGHRFCIYGVRGRNGGKGQVLISGRPPQGVSFYSKDKETHQLVFDSGDLQGSVQTASLSVLPSDQGSRGYVNVEEVEIR